MLKIAYCDDEQKERDKLMQALSHIEEKWGENFVITSFNNGDSLLKTLDKHNFDVVFLDILLDGDFRFNIFA